MDEEMETNRRLAYDISELNDTSINSEIFDSTLCAGNIVVSPIIKPIIIQDNTLIQNMANEYLESESVEINGNNNRLSRDNCLVIVVNILSNMNNIRDSIHGFNRLLSHVIIFY